MTDVRYLKAINTDITDPKDAAANGCAFLLDDTYYVVFEDPDDGYRSCAGEFATMTETEFNSTFPGQHRPLPLHVPVLVNQLPRGNSDFDGMELFDARNGKHLLSVGTDGSDNYYPCFVCNWQPVNMKENEA